MGFRELEGLKAQKGKLLAVREMEIVAATQTRGMEA